MRDDSLGRDHFEALYAARPDPWRLATSGYERGKHAATLSALPRTRYRRGFEIGCAIGVLTEPLARRCDVLLAVDPVATALSAAKARTAGQSNIGFADMLVPAQWPSGRFDLVVLSEVIDYLGEDDVAALAERLAEAIDPDGDLLMVHWVGKKRGRTAENEASDRLIALAGDRFAILKQARTPDYRLDLLRRRLIRPNRPLREPPAPPYDASNGGIMVETIRIHAFGGPEVMTLEDVALSPPGPGQVRLRQHAIGLNFLDVYQRTGLYPNALPLVPGNEGAGDVVAVGEGVTDFKPGDRVAYCMAIGAYAAERNVDAGRLVHLPEAISHEVGAVVMLKGLTAQYLLRKTHKVAPGDTILVQAAAGGVGLYLCQWAKALGATVIGTVGTEKKAALAKAHGADHTILYDREDFAVRVKEITGGKLCDVVYDGVGKATFPKSLDCIRPLGTFASFGSASGPIDAFNIGLLAQKGSLYATRPTLATFTAKREDMLAMAQDLMEAIASGAVKPEVHNRFRLSDAAEAHRALEARETSGSAILVP